MPSLRVIFKPATSGTALSAPRSKSILFPLSSSWCSASFTHVRGCVSDGNPHGVLEQEDKRGVRFLNIGEMTNTLYICADLCPFLWICSFFVFYLKGKSFIVSGGTFATPGHRLDTALE